MSFRVVAAVLDHSEERLASRLILVALAEAASDDGVCFLGQEEIARKARLARPYVGEAIANLAAREALQIRKAQRGRRKINVYRLNLPGLREEIDYDRLPFELDSPFDDVRTSDTVDADDVRNTGTTMSDPQGFSPGVPLLGEPPVEPEDPKSLVAATWTRLAPPLIPHREGVLRSDKTQRAIGGALRVYPVEEVVAAIENYAKILGSDEYVWSYRWTLPDFLSRGLDKFVPDADPLGNMPRKRPGAKAADFSEFGDGGY